MGTDRPEQHSQLIPNIFYPSSMAWSGVTCFLMCAVYTMFGVTLAVGVNSFWGENSPGFAYWNKCDEACEWFARAVGIWMAVVTTSPYWAGMPKDVLCKVYWPINFALMLHFCEAAFILKAAQPPPTNVLKFSMWYTQLPIAALLLLVNSLALGETGPNQSGNKSKSK